MEHFKGPSLHRPLNEADPSETRIIKLHPGLWEDPIVCDLEHFSLHNKEELLANGQELIALSYVWGDPKITEAIRVNKMEYPVTVNLFRALRWVRRRFNWITTLWVDALCINQADDKERTREVSRMGMIYANATLVKGYIGEPDDEQKNYMKLFAFSRWLRNEVDREMGKIEPDELLRRMRQHKDCPDDGTLLKVSTSAFFSRIWIVQELAMGCKEVFLQYGGSVAYFPNLATGYVLLRSNYETLSRSFLDGTTLREQVQGIITPWMIAQDLQDLSSRCDDLDSFAKTLLRYLRLTFAHHSTDQRDRIFALLGLLKADVPPCLLVSYCEPISKVFHTFTRFLLEHTGDLTIFESTPIHEAVPSWTMDLRFLENRPPQRPESSRLEISDDGMTLSVHGTRVGRVIEIMEVNDSLDVKLQQNIPALLKIMDNAEILTRKGLDLQPYEIIARNFQATLQDLHHWAKSELRQIKYLRQCFLSGFVDGKPDVKCDCYHCFAKLPLYSWILLDTGMVYKFRSIPGRSPVKQGDLVCFWKGARRLSILRQSQRARHFTYVHSCFIWEHCLVKPVSEDDWARLELENFLIV